MTQDLLVTIGEEFFVTQNTDGVTLTIGLYNDETDDLNDDSDTSGITTEPPNENYATVSETFNASKIGDNWGISNGGQLSFDFSDTTDDTVEVDTAFVTADFDSDESGSTEDNLIANPSLSQTRKIGSIDILEISTGDLELKLE